MNWFYYYSAGVLLSYLAIIVCEYLIHRNPTLSRWQKHAFFCLFLTILFGRAFEWISVSRTPFKWGSPTARKLLRHIEFMITPVVAFFAGLVFKQTRISLANLALIIINVIIQCISRPFNFFIHYDSDTNVILRGKFYWIYELIVIIGFILSTFSLFNTSRKRQYHCLPTLVTTQLIVLTASLLHWILPGLHIEWPVYTVSARFVYIMTVEICSETDGLTSLMNRQTFESILTHRNTNAKIIRIDIDNFKSINDRYGHRKGDKVLIDFSSIRRECFNRCGKVFRYGGDEFVILANKNRDKFEDAKKDFHQKWQNRITLHPFYPTYSFGQADFQPGSGNVLDILEEADKSRYKEKNKPHIR